MNQKANQHYRTTHANIRDAFLSLLKEKNLQDITITELCENLGISRGTFYLHYTDVYDLLNKTERAMSEELQQRFQAAREISNREAFLELFRFVEENRTFYSIYLERGNSMQVEEQLSYDEFQGANVPPDDPFYALSDVERYYHNAFFQAGVRTLLRCWFSRDCKESPEQLLDILKQQYHDSNLDL